MQKLQEEAKAIDGVFIAPKFTLDSAKGDSCGHVVDTSNSTYDFLTIGLS